MIVWLVALALVSWELPKKKPDTLLVGGRVVGAADARLDGQVVDVRLGFHHILAIGPDLDRADAVVVDVSGKWIAPPFIDSHVHLWLVADRGHGLRKHGVAGVVDLASPLKEPPGPQVSGAGLELRSTGPMITAIGGYPTTSWGRDGYGYEVLTAADARRAVTELLQRPDAIGVKVVLGMWPELSDELLTSIVEETHAAKRLVIAHALTDMAARDAADLGMDVLAHVPTRELADATIAAWSTRTVIPTLAAFGGSAVAVDNLRRLRAAGARVVYGTDLGNTQDARINPDELELMLAAGMDGAAILAAGTSAPAELWGFTKLGALAVGKDCSLLVLDEDPRLAPRTLSRPHVVYIRGDRQ